MSLVRCLVFKQKGWYYGQCDRACYFGGFDRLFRGVYGKGEEKGRKMYRLPS